MDKFDKLIKILKDYQKIVVAFSGGVDSSVLTQAAHLALGDKAIAVTADSPLLQDNEKDDAVKVAKIVGIKHILMKSDDLAVPEIAANDKNRCYYCKKFRFTNMCNWAKENGFNYIIEGSNLDDKTDYRPGMKAIAELSDMVKSPFLEAGIGKKEIRQIAHKYNLPVWNKPSQACLASRLAYGLSLTADRLEQVDKAERLLRQYINGQIRVRHHGKLARIEIMPEEFAKFALPDFRTKIYNELKELGFTFITLDMNGYKMGSQNAAISQIQNQPN
ncbi:ATP-dependent sacrificial sulfur transferase LarE [Pectinatus cerevisiiphilus]|uniref:ATP-dependent sacrificial sulfur transferase LarE n=1 Tax=Pectinatus cerevisiiphilus TaxID=86956 RepID=UPI0018C507EB|nr:ATP-dependent sacrificial sulfur transferase LarE [Pectinatus cerevisiiphilus]